MESTQGQEGGGPSRSPEDYKNSSHYEMDQSLPRLSTQRDPCQGDSIGVYHMRQQWCSNAGTTTCPKPTTLRGAWFH